MNKIQKKYPLYGKNILITGSSSGIGRSVALSYAEQGARLILISRDINNLESLYDSVAKSKYVIKPYIYPFDLLHASWNKYEKLYKIIKQEFGVLDGLVCNAGVLGKLSPIECFEIQQWYKVMQVNLNSVFMISKSLLPLLKLSENPVVICTTIDNTNIPKSFWGAYSVSKAALNNLVQVLSMENKKIVFHCIDPGKVNTKLTRKAFPISKLEDFKNTNSITEHFLYLMSNHSKSYNYSLYKI
jgi:NAD(P)-dependent dehydrogenase (short-subunit alcohol dehydrogenase family)